MGGKENTEIPVFYSRTHEKREFWNAVLSRGKHSCLVLWATSVQPHLSATDLQQEAYKILSANIIFSSDISDRSKPYLPNLCRGLKTSYTAS